MASILTPINAQLPAPAFGQSASAIGAYEQLRGIREKRELEAQARQRQALVSQLTGRALSGDQGAAQQLTMVAPDAAMELQKRQMEALKGQADIANIQSQVTTRQAELPQVQQQSADIQRQEAARRVQVLRGAVERVRQDPTQYESIKARLEQLGLAAPGTLPEQPPTPDELAALDKRLAFEADVMQSPEKQQQLSGVLLAASEALGRDSKEYRDVANRVVESELAEQEARTLKLSQEKTVNGVNIPVGLSLLDPSRTLSREEAKEARTAVDGIAPVLSTINALDRIVKDTGFEFLPTTDAKRAEALAAIIQLQLKDAFALGALDEGSAKFLQKIFSGKPTQWRQDIVKANIRDMRNTLVNSLTSKLRQRNLQADIPSIIRPGYGGGAMTSNGMPAVDAEKRTRLIQEMVDQGYTKQQAIEAMAALDSSSPTPAASVMPAEVRRERAAIEATPEQRTQVQQLLDSGMTVEQAAAEMRRRGGSSGRRAELPRNPTAAQRQMKQMPPVEAARAALNNPQSLTPEQRKEVIRKGIEGKGWLDAAAEVLGLGNGQ